MCESLGEPIAAVPYVVIQGSGYHYLVGSHCGLPTIAPIERCSMLPVRKRLFWDRRIGAIPNGVR